MPIVSVIMGVRNAAGSIERSVNSVLAQSHRDLELIVVNDGSTDNSGELLDRVAQIDNRLRVVHQANQGLTKSLINAVLLARGDYLVRQDADDYSLPDRIEKQLDTLKRNCDAVLATCWVDEVTETGVVCNTHKNESHTISLAQGADYTLTGIPAHGSVMMRKDAFLRCGGYRPCFYYAQDSDLWLRLSKEGRFVTVPQVLYQRTVDPNSLSSRFRTAQRTFTDLAEESFRRVCSGRSDADVLNTAEKLAATCRLRKDSPATRRDQSTSLMLIAAVLRDKTPELATRYFCDALIKDPTHLRAWKGLLVHTFKRTIGGTS